MVGNFIADAVKGKQLQKFPVEIQQGIHLHREIDSFTDSHETTRLSKSRLYPKYRHYSAVIVDIFYDHFLAAEWSDFHDESLESFTGNVYETLNEYESILPKRIKYMLQYMVPQNWLLNYGNLEGVARVLKGMSNRTSFDSGMERAIEDLELHYEDFRNDFFAFFPDLEKHSENFKENLK